MRPKARESCDLLMLALFVLIPPNRGLEIRTLELVGDERDMTDAGARKTSQRNLVFLHDDKARIQLNNYKTKKFRGRDEMELKVNKCVDLYIIVTPQTGHSQSIYLAPEIIVIEILISGYIYN